MLPCWTSTKHSEDSAAAAALRRLLLPLLLLSSSASDRLDDSKETDFKMAWFWISGFLYCNAFIVIVISSPRWDRKNGMVEVKQGDDLIITCTVHRLVVLDVVRLVKVNTESNTITTISDNDNVKQPFSTLSRYEVRYGFRSGTASVTLHYHGIRGEDAGIIGCYKLADERDVARLSLKVFVPVASLNLYSTSINMDDRIEAENGKLKLSEFEHSGILCTASISGSLVPPNLKILIDGKDETKQFNATQTSQDYRSDDVIGEYYATKTLSLEMVKPKIEWNFKNLTCLAICRGFSDVKTSAILDIHYKPVVICPKYEVHGRLGGGVTLTCDVRANPSSYISWTYGDKGELFDRVEEITNSNNTRITERVLKPDHTQISLRIYSLDDSHFTDFHLTAKNDIGETEAVIEVHREGSSSSYHDDPKNYLDQGDSHAHLDAIKSPDNLNGSHKNKRDHRTIMFLTTTVSILIWYSIDSV